jgi:hypothetical protein
VQQSVKQPTPTRRKRLTQHDVVIPPQQAAVELAAEIVDQELRQFAGNFAKQNRNYIR